MGELPTYKQKMACKVTLLCFSIILSVFFHFVCGQNHEDIDKDNSVILPPCVACTTLVNSFLSKLKINSVEFDSILAQTCSGVSRGKNQCVENAQKWSPYLKDWFQNHQEVVLNLKEWLCIDKI